MKLKIFIAVILSILIIVSFISFIVNTKTNKAPDKAGTKTEYQPDWRLISEGRKVLNDMIENPYIYKEGLEKEQLSAFKEIISIYQDEKFLNNTQREEFLYQCLAASTYQNEVDYIMALKAFNNNNKEVFNGNNK